VEFVGISFWYRICFRTETVIVTVYFLYDMPEIISLSVRPFASQRVLNREKLGGF
jgi:hypothetical protein